MATVNFYDTPLSDISKSQKVKSGQTIENIVDKYIEEKGEYSEKFEIYDTKTGETTYETVVSDSYKVATIVNGEEKPLSYKIKKKDIVTVIFVPQGKTNGADILSFIGSALMIGVGIILCCTGGGASAGVPMILGGVMTLTATIISIVTRPDEQVSGKNDSSKLEAEAALTISGAENPLIADNRFPFIFGKMATNPYIVGSPVHETYLDENGKFDCQYMSALYCLGYGPLKLTDFKIANTWLNYNRPRDVDGERDNKTVMHGFIDSHTRAVEFEQSVADSRGYFTYNENKNGYMCCDTQPTAETFSSGIYYKLNHEISQKWKNNDVTMEIIQRGLNREDDLSEKDKWGEIYNKTTIEDSVDANIIFIHDEDIHAAAERQYKGVAIPEGFRTNTVRLSQACPSHIEVELDFQSGIHRSRSEKNGNVSHMRYYDIPIRFAVQWRPIRSDNPTPDAESGDGWRSFDYLKTGLTKSTWQEPSEYTMGHAVLDMSLNAGASFNTSAKFTDSLRSYANEYVYKPTYNSQYTRDQANADAEVDRQNALYGSYYSKIQKKAVSDNNAREAAQNETDKWINKNINNPVEIAPTLYDAGYLDVAYNPGWIGQKVFHINKNKSYTTGHSPKDFDGNERLYVFSKDFTAEEAKEILDSGSDKIEVRVIRLTPCYIDQNGSSSETYGDFSYQDLCKWSTLRTTCFDKDAYKEAIKKNPDAKPEDYPLRPVREEDLKKFTYVAIRLKQDVAETGGSVLKQMRVTAESFSPTWDNEEKHWWPEDVVKKYRYYQKVRNEDGSWKVQKLTEEEYVEKKLAREDNLFRENDGNNFVSQVCSDIFTAGNSEDDSRYKKYFLSEDVSKRYNNTNSASSTMLAVVGPQNGDEAKIYDDINLTAAAEMFNFCEDVTDGTPDTESPDGLKHIKYSCNGVITSEEKLEDVVKKFLITGRSILKRDDENRYEFFVGREQKFVMNVLNNKNVISKTNARTFTDTPSGFQMVFPDEDDDYTQNPLYVMDRGEDWRNPSKPMEPLTIQYVTNRDQLWSLGLFNLAGRVFQRETYNRTVGKMGLSLSIGDVLLIQDDSLLVGSDNGARIIELIGDEEEYEDDKGRTRTRFTKIYGFTTDDAYEYTGETEDGLCTQGVTIVQPDRYGVSRCVTLRMATLKGNDMIGPDAMHIGPTNIVAFEYPITVSEDGNYSEEAVTSDGFFVTLNPKPGDLVAFGYVTKITEKAQIVGIKPSSGKYNLNLVPYDDKYYQYGRELPQFTPKMTTPKVDELEFDNFVDYATKADVTDAKAVGDGNKRELTVDPTCMTEISMCKATRDGIVATCNVTQDGKPLTPMSVTWKVYFEDVVCSYKLAEEQPDETTDFVENFYFKLVNDQYERVFTYEEGVTYFVEDEAQVVDTLLFEEVSDETNYIHLFDRSGSVKECNGYPEYDDLYPIKITATAKLTVTSKTPESYFSRVDVTNYGTWIPSKPVIDVTVQDRVAILSFTQPAKQRALYGQDSIVYKVQIRRLEDGDTENFAKPDTNSSPYVEYENKVMVKRNETAYKVFKKVTPTKEQVEAGGYYTFVDSVDDTKICDYVETKTYTPGYQYYAVDGGESDAMGTFTQTLPLKGQGDNNAVPTLYEYRVRAVSINGRTTEYSNCIAKALVTNIRDIVKANATAKEEYVENLSAISAKLGDISDGSLTGSENNYWTLSTKENARTDHGKNNRNFQGAFRVGDDKEFFMCEPVLDSTESFVESYKISFKVGNFEVSSSVAQINNILDLYDEADFAAHDGKYHTKRLRVSQAGMVIQTNSGTADEGVDSDWSVVGQVKFDERGNLIISNCNEEDPEFPKLMFPVKGFVYHFDKDLNDEFGNNGGEIDRSGTIATDSSTPFSTESDKVLSGSMKKSLVDYGFDMLFFCKNSSVRMGNDVITESVETISNFNTMNKSSWGLSPSDNLFKYKE